MQSRYAGCLLAALLLSSCGGSSNDKATTQAGPQRLDVTARDFALKINGSPAYAFLNSTNTRCPSFSTSW